MVARRPLAEELSDALLHDILSGTFPPGTILPSETELAERSGMSRLTVREAIKDLRSKRVVEVNQGRGTFVNQPTEWSVLDPVLLIARSSYGEDSLELERQFLEARRTVEVQIARMAATRRTDHHLQALGEAILEMKIAAQRADVDAFVRADIAFHQGLMEAAGNPFITALFEPMAQILHLTRHQTSAHAPVREHAIDHHQKILDALSDGDPDDVAASMHDHLMQTEEDLGTYVRDSAQSLSAVRRGSTHGGIDSLPTARSTATESASLSWGPRL
jgi:GntR family transcriptional repressor for pyruvate dehydrogenase complex